MCALLKIDHDRDYLMHIEDDYNDLETRRRSRREQERRADAAARLFGCHYYRASPHALAYGVLHRADATMRELIIHAL